MTPHHCDHECVCYLFGQNCFTYDSPCYQTCKHDTRSKTPTPAAPDCGNCRKVHCLEQNGIALMDMIKEQKATIRNQTLKEIAIELQEIVDVMGTENPVSQAYLAVINMTRLKREAQSLRTQEHQR